MGGPLFFPREKGSRDTVRQANSRSFRGIYPAMLKCARPFSGIAVPPLLWRAA